MSEQDQQTSKQKTFTVGGSIEKALSGQVELSPVAVLQEAWRMTWKNLLSFAPATILLALAYTAVFLAVLQIKLGDISIFLSIVTGQVSPSADLAFTLFTAGFSAQVLIAPLTAGVSLMGMSYAVGIKCNVRYLFQGWRYAGAALLVTLAAEILQGLVSIYLPLVSLYFSMTFGLAILLVCEKQITPLRALRLSFQASNRKFFAVLALHIVFALALIFSIALSGIGLLFVLPFIFTVKGIMYRNIFGVTMMVTIADKNEDDENQASDKTKSSMFNA